MDVLERDFFDGVDFDVAVFHRVAIADLDVRVFPDADAASDGSAADVGAEAFGEEQDGVECSRRGRVATQG